VPAANVPLVAPAGIRTWAGTVSHWELLESDTDAPPGPAAFEKVTVQLAVAPSARLAGAQANAAKAGSAWSTSRVVVREAPFSVAVSVAVWSTVTVPAAATKFAELLPAVTVTEGGTVSVVVLLASVATAPPGPAALDRVTVQVALPPWLTPVGAQESRMMLGGITREIVAGCEEPLSVAVMAAVWSLEIVPAVAVKLAELLPDATVTDAGTVRVPRLLDRPTRAPPAPAGLVRVMVQVELAPVPKVAGLHESAETSMVEANEMEAVWELPLREAVTVAVWSLEIVPAVAAKFAELLPDATVTDAGTVRVLRLLNRPTTAPPVPAALVKVTVQVELAPVPTLAGLHDTPLTSGGFTSAMLAVFELEPRVAVTVAVWSLVTVPAVAMKFAEALPDATVTDAGTESAPTLLDNTTEDPPAGAATSSVTLHVELPPDPKEAGVQLNAFKTGCTGMEAVIVPP
jgi:hypothetical protein